YSTCYQIYETANYEGAYQAFSGFLEDSPADSLAARAHYYMGECARRTGLSEKAATHYKTALDSDGASGSLKLLAAKGFADISYALQNYSDAVTGYTYLQTYGDNIVSRNEGLWGLGRSYYAMQSYAAAIPVWERIHILEPESVEGTHHLAKCYLSTSQRDRAKELFRLISGKTKTPEGAEAAWFLIQDTYDSGNFEDVQKMVYDLVDSKCNQTYYLAKSFITLGDAFMELGNETQAKATFESVLNGYTDSEEITSAVKMRLEKLK
ncbi:MAG: tetratricopeptide repeat protein, partial [Bacteroidales bacterium]|nr:tetratricopeptide repeat protein [Bacteroidales bacterium]